MDHLTLIATSKFGLESLVRDELIALGFDQLRVSNGRVEFEASPEDIPRANLWLRCADRVLLKMGQFRAVTFDDLYEQCRALPWESLITKDGKFAVSGKTVKSTLRSVRSCQSIVKKAVVDRLAASYGITWFAETGPDFAIQVSLLRDIATLTIDTSGIGLHKRGYRPEAVEAPLKETLAAALVKLTDWDQGQILIDPMCGSGTIPIEAAMLARNIAPGLNRSFASESWPAVIGSAWLDARAEAMEAREARRKLQIFGYDISKKAIEISMANAKLAGVAGDIVFVEKEIRDMWIDRQYGVVITNPPYGKRISEFREINQIYHALNQIFRKKRGWSIYVLTADQKFPRYFKRSGPDRVRKLYNGTIEVNYYQYVGEKQTGDS
jgi:putative N6-adenine-specific DNA methylase